jgi:hypothetical protein
MLGQDSKMVGSSRIASRTLFRGVLNNAGPIAAFLAFACTAATASEPNSGQTQPGDIWFGIYLQNRPIGGSHEFTSKVVYDGRKCVLTTSTSHVAILLLGTSVQQDVVSRDWVDAVTAQPVSEVDEMASGGDTTTVTATFSGRTVTAVMVSGASTETHVLTVPAGCILMTDDPTTSPPTDTHKKYVYFDPETLRIESVVITPAPGEPAVHPHRLIVTMPTGSVTVEQDDNGVPLRVDMPGGISMVRRSEQIVSAYMIGNSFAASIGNATGGEASAPDFAVVTSVVPTGQPLLASPTSMTVEVSESGGPAKTYVIDQVSVPENPPIGDSIADIQGRSDLAPDLANTAYLGLDDPKIIAQSEEIASGRTNLYDIAVQIQQWIHQQMIPTPSIGVPRSAAQIMEDRRGVCRDYALLYTAFARAAHVPTRLCAGLVGYRGRFYYHAWAESYIGGTIGWMPFDPTLNELPVDASHIPLVKGDPVNLYDLVGNIGATKVVIVRCER